MYIHRELEKRLASFLERREAIAILGPRQAGKTTFLKFLEEQFKKKHRKVKFITFEKRHDLDLFENSIEDFKTLISDYHYVIIDEFQYAREGGQKLKYLYDTTNVKYIVSGSSSLELTFQTGKYMVGRMFDFPLFPFSFREFLSVYDGELYHLLQRRIHSQDLFDFDIKKSFKFPLNQRLARLLESYVIYGGYPAVVLSKTSEEKQKILESIIDNYLLKDIRGVLKLATDNELIKLSRFLAAQIGGIFVYNELSRTSGLTYREVLKHISILEKTFLVKSIRPFFTNKRTELRKNPKCYFFDLGVRNFLLSDFRPFDIRNDQGAMIENYIFSTLQRLNLGHPLKYWRTKSKAEVDFVIEKEQLIIPIEVKYTSREILGKSLHSFIEKFKPKKAIVFTKDHVGEVKIRQTKVQFIPATYF